MKSLLLQYAQPMKDLGDAPYRYDYSSDLNVYVDKYNQSRPFVECKEEILCVSTKTEASRETDDSIDWSIAISTKTFTEKESDD